MFTARPSRIRVNFRSCVLSAALLTLLLPASGGGAAGTAAASAANGAGALQAAAAASPAPALRLTANFVYYDEASGSYFYEAYPADAQRSYVIFVDRNGGWHRLSDEYSSLYRDRRGSLPRINGAYGTDFFAARYDVVSNKVIYEADYRQSPDGRWGVAENTTFTAVRNGAYTTTVKSVRLLLKSRVTGKLVDWKESREILNAAWLSDSTLVSRGSALFGTKEGVVRHDPATGRTTDLTRGFYPVVSADGTQVLFYRRGADQQTLLMARDVATGKERSVAYPDEYEALLAWPRIDEADVPAVPADLTLAELPVTTPSAEYRFEHDVVLDDLRIAVPYAILYRNEAYLPLRYLIDAGAVEVEASGVAPQTVSHDGRTVRLDAGNGRQYGTRLYVKAAVLRQLGYANVAVVNHSGH